MQSRQYNFFWKYSVVKIPYNIAENIKLKLLFIPNLSKIMITIEMHIIEAIKTKIFLINIMLFPPSLLKKTSPLVSFKGEDKKHNCFISLIYFSYFLRIKL